MHEAQRRVSHQWGMCCIRHLRGDEGSNVYSQDCFVRKGTGLVFYFLSTSLPLHVFLCIRPIESSPFARFQGTPSTNVEALSWKEYRRALSELCPALHRYENTAPAEDIRSTASPPRNSYIHSFQSTATSPSRLNHGTQEHGPVSPAGFGSIPMTSNDNPPRSSGADSFNVLRRKRQAAISLDYESLTINPPQVWQGSTKRVIRHCRLREAHFKRVCIKHEALAFVVLPKCASLRLNS